jgi:Bacteriophage HK97-gp10, putative tail-component
MASRFEIHLNEADLAAFQHDPNGAVAMRVLSEAGRIVTRAAVIRAPVDTGRLQGSIGWEHGQDGQGPFVRVYAEWYDVFLEKPARQMKRAHRTLRTAIRQLPRVIGG